MYTFQECQDIINKALLNLQFEKRPVNLYKPIEYILSIGGKRIRPALVLMAANIFSDKIENAINAALAIEVFHNFTLLHDDIMDNSSLRRGRDTVHKKWNANIAILSGDAMSIIAYDILIKTNTEIKNKILPIFTTTALEVCEGQQLDLDFESKNNVSVDEYIQMITLKTSVLLAASLKIGAIAGGAGETDADHLYQYGKNIGIAFQLQDDLLDVYGDPKLFGKNNGGDIVSNKKTYLLIKALELSNGEKYKKLTGILENSEIGRDEKIRSVVEIYDSLQLKELTVKMVNFYFNEAVKHIDKLAVNPEKLTEINSFSDSLMNRSF